MKRSTLKSLDGSTLSVQRVMFTFRLKATEPRDVQITGQWETTARNLELAVNKDPSVPYPIYAKATDRGIEVGAK